MITVDQNSADIARAFEMLTRSITNMAPVMDEIGQKMVQSTKQRMRKGVSPDGKPFAPRSPVTLARYAAEGKKYGPHPLWLTRTMRQQVAHHAGDDAVSWESNAIQSAVIHFGAKQGEFGAKMGRTKPSETQPRSRDYFVPLTWADIPACPFLGLSDQDRGHIVEIIHEHLWRSTEQAMKDTKSLMK